MYICLMIISVKLHVYTHIHTCTCTFMSMYMYLLFTNLQEELATSVSKHIHMYESAPDTTSVSFFP